MSAKVYTRKGYRYVYRGIGRWQIFPPNSNVRCINDCKLTKRECEEWIDDYVLNYAQQN